jgi:hypothetical protein
MKKYSSVEDYIEVMNGDRNPDTGTIYSLFNSTLPIISLARYDVQILSSMSQTTQSGRALTDRQAELAVKLVLKYRKQLEKLDIDVGPVESPVFRLGIRQIDRRRLLYVDHDNIVLKFPYDTTLINDLRDLAKISQGRWRFDPANRAWALAITETNVVAANGFAQNHQFEIAPEVAEYLEAVELCEQQPYQIQLTRTPQGLQITNAAKSLQEAVLADCGLDDENLDRLVDCSAIYGYTVDEQIQLDAACRYSPRICNLLLAQETKFAPNSDATVVKDIIRYADITQRYPIYVYEPDMSNRLLDNFVRANFDPEDVYQSQTLGKLKTFIDKKVIYFNKFSAKWDQPVPLLISGQGMMHGGEKTMLIQQAEKVVYFATEVYNIHTIKTKN